MTSVPMPARRDDLAPVVLVVDDDPGVRYTLREVLAADGYGVLEAEDGAAAWAAIGKTRVDLVITDLRMPGVDGLALLERLKGMTDPPRAVVVTAHGSERHAVAAMKLGALDYLSKPFDIDEVRAIARRALGTLLAEREAEALRAELALARHLVFRSAAMRKVALMIHRVAPRDVAVLLRGPSGTGKERVAEALVAASARASRPFVRFNCAALPRDLAEAELFGHARGAFTGAVRGRDGVFREADGGTLFLDEVGELDPLVQGKLLRVLQDGSLRPVGFDQEVRVDVRVIAATHRDLAADVKAGRFREDLYYRLAVVCIDLPPLAERRDDIPPLIDHFLAKYASRFGLPDAALTPRARLRLESDPWPGNVRELEHRIEALIALSPDGRLDLGDAPASAEALTLRDRVDAFERGLVLDELRRCNGNRSEAARRLGVARITLLDKLKKHGLGEDI